MLINSFNLKDIKEYESSHRANILNYFNEIKIQNILDLISLGNGGCDTETSSAILDNYLKDGGNLLSAILEIKEALLGKGENTSEDAENENLIDITKYESLTDLYINYSMQLMSVGLSYSEFWSMNTKELFKVFNSILIKIQNETNRELNNYHTLAAMIGGAVWGKLQKKPPHVDFTQKEEIDGLDSDDLIMMAKLKDFTKRHNDSIKNNEEVK